MSADLVHFLPPMPDLGQPWAFPDPADPGSYQCNVAMTVRLARHEPTPVSARFYRAFCKHWDLVKFGPGPVDRLQATAMERTCDEVGFNGLFKRQPS